MKNIVIGLISLLLCVFLISSAWALSSQHVVELKKAGISDQTIQVITQEKVIETAAFSIEDIVAMKKAGVGEQTIQMIIRDGSFSRNREPIVYGRSTQSVRNISPEEVINLKKNRVSDEVIQSIIEASKSDDQQDRERAWRMLENMQLRVHVRERH